MSELTEFLRDREQDMRFRAEGLRTMAAALPPDTATLLNEIAAWIERDMAARRRLVDEVFQYEATIDGEWGCCHSAESIAAGECQSPDRIPALRLLALPFDQHPGYQESWRP